MSKQFYVYILSNNSSNTLYIGISSNLQKRLWQHKNKLVEGFSKKYNLNKLVYYEIYEEVQQAITREKQLKKWKRCWKDDLVSKSNPTWVDLSVSL